MTIKLRSFTHALFAATLITGAALATPSMAAQLPTKSSITVGEEVATPSQPVRKMGMHGHVEKRIAALHIKLQITPAQEEAWGKVAETMRANSEKMMQEMHERHKDTSMNAIDRLKASKEMAKEHAEGLSNLISAFEPLYDSMSDAQKKVADVAFQHEGPSMKGKMKQEKM